MPTQQLTLVGSTVKRITKNGILLYHFTEAGVDVHNMAGDRIAWASLANVTSGAVNDNGVYLGTTAAGVYKLALSAVATGGDQTAALTQDLTTTSTPALASNAVAWLDGTGTALIAATAAGTDYLPTAATVYRYADAAGCIGCTINATEIAYILASGNVHRLSAPAADWTATGATVYAAGSGVPTLNYEGAPTVNNDYAYNLFWSPDGTKLFYCNGDANTSLWMYSRSGSTLTKSTEANTNSFAYGGGSISDDGTLIAVADYSSPFLSWYSLSGTTITRRAAPTTALPRSCRPPTWCPADNQYLAVCHYTDVGGSGLYLYKRNGTTSLARVAEIAHTLGNVYSVKWNGNYLAVGHQNAPYVSLYRRDGDTLTKLADTGINHDGLSINVAWGGNYLAVTQSVTYTLVVYEFDPETETFTKLTGLDGTLASYTGGIAWHSNGTLLAVGVNFAPWLQLYSFDGDELTLVASSDGGVLTERPNSVEFAGDYLAVIQSTTPSGIGVRLFSVGESGSSDLLGAANTVSLGTDLFVGSDNGIDVIGAATREIAAPGSKPVKSLCPTPAATTATGHLAFGTRDGSDGGQFGIIDLSV